MRFQFYQNDYRCRDSWRSTEDSLVVARYWLDAACKFEVETADIPEGCSDIVAERILFRGIVGIPDMEAAGFGKARPFGIGGPMLRELLDNNVKTAVAFIPLIREDDHEAMLARLYCVSGLNQNVACRLEGSDDPALTGCNWFLAGVPDNVVRGRSWMLAARILEHVLKSSDKGVKANLISQFIVTGDVRNDTICPVEIGCKVKLSENEEYKNFKWVVAMGNKTEMEKSGMSARMIESPSSLDEALKLIETMQSKATRSFFRFAKAGNLEGMKEQHDIGADIFSVDIKTGSSVMMLVKNAIQSFDKEEKKIGQFRKIRSWLQAEGADPMMMFYVLAKFGLDDVLRQCIARWPIEARDEDGYNAAEFALTNGNFELAKKLSSYGCRCGASFIDESLQAAIESCFSRVLRFAKKKEDESVIRQNRECVRTALQIGLSPDLVVASHSYKTSIFGLALYRRDLEMIECCLEAGADPSKEIEIYQRRIIECPDGEECACWEKDELSGTALYIVKFSTGGQWGAEEISDEQRAAAEKILVKYGASNDERVAKRLFSEAVSTLGTITDSSKNRESVLIFLDDGFSYEEPKEVKYSSATGDVELLKTTLWGWAVYNGDIEVMRKCLEKGAGVNSPLQFLHKDLRKQVVDLQYLNGRTPVEVILMSEDIPLGQQNTAFSLLKEKGLNEQEVSKELLDNRHAEEVQELECMDDINVECCIEMGGSVEYPEIAETNTLGMALWYEWTDVMEKCLSLGASARNVLHYRECRGGLDGVPYVFMSVTPREIMDKKKHLPRWKRQRVLKLLAKYANE